MTASVDGVTITNWKCVTINTDGDPETLYPGCTYPDYDDSAWTEPLVILIQSYLLYFIEYNCG